MPKIHWSRILLKNNDKLPKDTIWKTIEEKEINRNDLIKEFNLNIKKIPKLEEGVIKKDNALNAYYIDD